MTDIKLKSIADLKQKIEQASLKKDKEKHTILTVSAGTCGQARGSLKVVKELEKVIKEKKLGVSHQGHRQVNAPLHAPGELIYPAFASLL